MTHRIKKIRGLKRKIKSVIFSFYKKNLEFPDAENMWYGCGWYMKPGIRQRLIDSSTTPLSVKRLLLQSAINEVERLVSLKPVPLMEASVNYIFNINELFYSSIDIFYTNDSKVKFFKDYLKIDRVLESDNNYYRTKFTSIYNIKLSDTLKVYYTTFETLDEEINKVYKHNYWVIGEL